VLTRDEARRIAANIAKLPDPIRQRRAQALKLVERTFRHGWFAEETDACDGRSLRAVSIAVAPPAVMITMIVMQRHIPAFSIGRPVPGPRLRPIGPAATTASGRAGRHQCGRGNEGGCGQAADHRFGRHGSSPCDPTLGLHYPRLTRRPVIANTLWTACLVQQLPQSGEFKEEPEDAVQRPSC
jgi:hypothetical protein